MVQYFNNLQRLVVEYLAREIPHQSIEQGQEGIGLKKPNGLKAVDSEHPNIDLLEVRKAWNFSEEGDLFIYEGRRISPPLDVKIARALTQLNQDHGFEVRRHDEEDGRVKYYISPKKGCVQDTDLGTFYKGGKTLAEVLESVPPTGDATDTILGRAEEMGRPVENLPNWQIPERDN